MALIICELRAGSCPNHCATLSYKALLVQKKSEKNIGRPIAYKGDPNASHLSEAERRCIKRRIGNRESARRARARRHETLEEFQVRVSSQRAATGPLAMLHTSITNLWSDNWCL